MKSPSEYINEERLKRGYNRKFGSIDHKNLDDYLAYLPTENDKQIASNIWKGRNNKSVSEIWEETTQEYKNHLLIGLVDIKELKKLVDETYIGVLPTGEVNAFATYAENGERMIILNEGLLYTIHFWSSFFLRSLDENNDDFFWKDEKVRCDALHWIYNIWTNQLDNDLDVPNIFPKKADSWALSQLLTFSTIVFVLAHEFGHILHNHNGYSNDRRKNHEMEFQADRIGLETAFKYSFYRGITNFKDDTFFMKFMLYSPYLLFNIFALFGIHNTHTHPSVLHRLENIEHFYENFAQNYLGPEKFNTLMRDIDADYFQKMNRIGEKHLNRHLRYSDELKLLMTSW